MLPMESENLLKNGSKRDMKEKIYYAEDIPISITVGNYIEHPIHFHDDLEIVYLLKGNINMRNGHYSYRLKEGDIYFFNEREMHSFEAVEGEPNMVLILHIDLKYYSKYYEGKLENNFFVSGVDSDDGDDEHLEMLKAIISKIMVEMIQKGYGYEHRIIEKTHNMISLLLSDFQHFLLEDGKFVNCKWKKENKILSGRLMRITTYMYDNYHRKLTLNEIADNEHLSLFYLSHVIKESTGLSFQGLLNFIRVEESEKLVLDTRKKMGAIAEECGFSALRYFVKHFEQWFGMPPSEYREKYAGKTSNRKSMAVIERATVPEIEEAIKYYVGNQYEEYKNQNNFRSYAIEIDGTESSITSFKEKSILEVFAKGKALTLVKPFQMFKGIGDRIVKEGSNYIVAKNIDERDGKTQYSILVSYADSELVDEILSIEHFEEIENISKQDVGGRELLINIKGLKGNLRIARYRTSRISVLENLKKSKEGTYYSNDRDKVIAAIRGFPKVDYESIPAGENVLVRSILNSMESELILIDEENENNK